MQRDLASNGGVFLLAEDLNSYMLQIISNIEDVTDHISLETAKDWLSVSGNAHDDKITLILGMVLEWWRREGGNIPVVYRLTLPSFCDVIELKHDADDVVIKYYKDGTQETLDDESYRVRNRLDLNDYVEPVTSWPSHDSRNDAVQIEWATWPLTDFDKGSIAIMAALVMQNREGFEVPSGLLRIFSHVRGATYG